MWRRLALTSVASLATCILLFYFTFKSADRDALETKSEATNCKDFPRARTIHHYHYPFIENGTTGTYGRQLSIDFDFMKTKGFTELPLTKFADDINDDNWDKLNFAFVTMSTDNHFEETMDCVASIQMFFPGKPILYYDLGLAPTQVTQLKKWCNVEYRKMDISDFEVVKQLNATIPFTIYAMKTIIIAHALQDYDGVFWVDASIRFISSNMEPVFKMAKDNGGLVFMSRVGHSTYAVTDPVTYTLLPTNQEKQKKSCQSEANSYFIYKSKKIYQNIVWWLLLCGLEKECISPSPNVKCTFPPNQKRGSYAGCHRYDQSAINILAANLFDFDDSKYFVNMKRLGGGHQTLIIRRKVTNDYVIKQC